MKFDIFCCVLIIIHFARNGNSLERKPVEQTTTEEPESEGDFGIAAVGGEPAEDNEFPHMAALGFGNTSSPHFLCGGTLISDQYVMTAAHCTTFRNMGPLAFVKLGTTCLLATLGDFQEIGISDVIVHPDYAPPTSYNDIALLKLERRVKFAKNVLPARLQINTELDRSIIELNATGWGKTDVVGPTADNLVKVTLKVVSYTFCRDSYKGVSPEKLPDGVIHDIQICAGGDIGKDTCQGDSGGPLGYKMGQYHHVAGITSVGKACGLTPSPGIYTRVSAFFPWIASIVFASGK